MTTTYAPLDNPDATTYNAVVLSDDQNAAAHFDYLLRSLILGFPHRRIIQIKMLRAAANAFGAEMGLKEAKQTLDTMTARMLAEAYRLALSSMVGSPIHVEATEKIEKLTS